MAECPICGRPGLEVENLTVAAHVKESCWPLGKGPFFHCPAPDCDAVYFTVPEGRIIRRPDAKTRVTFKEKEGVRPLCYCRQVTEDDVTAAIKGGATTLEEVRKATGIGGGGECRITNPAGRCCSRNYRPFIERELADARPRSSEGRKVRVRRTRR